MVPNEVKLAKLAKNYNMPIEKITEISRKHKFRIVDTVVELNKIMYGK